MWTERLSGRVAQHAMRGRTSQHRSESPRSVPGMSLSSVDIYTGEDTLSDLAMLSPMSGCLYVIVLLCTHDTTVHMLRVFHQLSASISGSCRLDDPFQCLTFWSRALWMDLWLGHLRGQVTERRHALASFHQPLAIPSPTHSMFSRI